MLQINLQQRIFSNAPIGLDGSGWQVLACSRGFQPETSLRRPEYYYPFKVVRELMPELKEGEDDVEFLRGRLPVNWGWFYLNDQQAVVHRIGYSGYDDVPRPGNFVAHDCVVSKSDLEKIDYDIPSLIRWISQSDPLGFARSYMDVYRFFMPDLYEQLLDDNPLPSDITAENLSGLPDLVVDVDDIHQIREDTDAHFRENILKPLHDTLGAPVIKMLIRTQLCEDEHRRPIVLQNVSDGANESELERIVIDMLFSLLPYHCRRKLTFSTYASDVKAEDETISKLSLMMTNRCAPVNADSVRHSVYLLDCENPATDIVPQTDIAKKYLSWMTSDFGTIKTLRGLCSSFDEELQTEGIADVLHLREVAAEVESGASIRDVHFDTFEASARAAREGGDHERLVELGHQLIQLWKPEIVHEQYLFMTAESYLALHEKHEGADSRKRKSLGERLGQDIVHVIRCVVERLDVEQIVSLIVAAGNNRCLAAHCKTLLDKVMEIAVDQARHREMMFAAEFVHQLHQQIADDSLRELVQFRQETGYRLCCILTECELDSLNEEDRKMIVEVLASASVRTAQDVIRRLEFVADLDPSQSRSAKLCDQLVLGLVKHKRIGPSLFNDLVAERPDLLLRHFRGWKRASELEQQPSPVCEVIANRLEEGELMKEYCAIRPVRPHRLLDNGLLFILEGLPNSLDEIPHGPEVRRELLAEGLPQLTKMLQDAREDLNDWNHGQLKYHLAAVTRLVELVALNEMSGPSESDDAATASENEEDGVIPSGDQVTDEPAQAVCDLILQVVAILVYRKAANSLIDEIFVEMIESPLAILFDCLPTFSDRCDLFVGLGQDTQRHLQENGLVPHDLDNHSLRDLLRMRLSEETEVVWHLSCLKGAITSKKNVPAFAAAAVMLEFPGILNGENDELKACLEQRGYLGPQTEVEICAHIIRRCRIAENRGAELLRWFSPNGSHHRLFRFVKVGKLREQLIEKILSALRDDLAHLHKFFVLLQAAGFESGLASIQDAMIQVIQQEKGNRVLTTGSGQSVSGFKVLEMAEAMISVMPALETQSLIAFWAAVHRAFLGLGPYSVRHNFRGVFLFSRCLAGRIDRTTNELWESLFTPPEDPVEVVAAEPTRADFAPLAGKGDALGIKGRGKKKPKQKKKTLSEAKKLAEVQPYDPMLAMYEQMVAASDGLYLDQNDRCDPVDECEAFTDFRWAENLLHGKSKTKGRNPGNRLQRFDHLRHDLATLPESVWENPQSEKACGLVAARALTADAMLGVNCPGHLGSFISRLACRTSGRPNTCVDELAACAVASLIERRARDSSVSQATDKLLGSGFWKAFACRRHLDRARFGEMVAARLTRAGAGDDDAKRVSQQIRKKFKKWFFF